MQETLEQAILANPNDASMFAVYADWLAERGDPRGEFINVQLALEDGQKTESEREALRAREAALLDAYQDTWLGPLGPLLRENAPVHPAEDGWGEVPNYTFRFARGFLHTLEMERLLVPVARALRDWPGTRLLRSLSIGAIETGDHEHVPGDDVPTWEKDQVQFVSGHPLRGADFAGLRRFQLGAETDFDAYLSEEYGPSCHTYCEVLPELLDRMPRVEELHLLCKDYDLAKVFASQIRGQLRVLRIAHYGVYGRRSDASPYAYPLDVLAKNPAYRNLTHLLFHPHHEEWHREHSGSDRKGSFLPLPAVRALLHSPHLQGLTHLQLRLSNMGDEGVREIVNSGVLSRLVDLDLRHGCITDVGAKILVEHKDTQRLQRLDLGGNALSGEGVALLTELGPFASAEYQMSESEIADEAYLYKGDTE